MSRSTRRHLTLGGLAGLALAAIAFAGVARPAPEASGVRPASAPSVGAAVPGVATGAATPVAPRPAARSRAPRTFSERYEALFEGLQGLTASKLAAGRRVPYLAAHGLDVARAEHLERFVRRFKLSPQAKATLRRHGFVVIPAHSRTASRLGVLPGAGPADLFYRVFHADLPVYVSADSILHAWHRSFDRILEHVESSRMRPLLQSLLGRTLARLDLGVPAERDAALVLAVARSLLEPTWRPPAALQGDVKGFRRHIARLRPAEVVLLGERAKVDFSHFRPRGHYAESWSLQTYFRAMMWLGRIDLVLRRPSGSAAGWARSEAAARAIARAIASGRATDLYRRIDGFYGAVVGKGNALSPLELLALCGDAGQPGCIGNGAGLDAKYAARGSGAYSGRYLARDRDAVTMRLFPQRFAYDAWVMSRTTTPRLGPPLPGGRAMASPLDVAYALGSERALHHLGPELGRPQRERLPAALEAARQTLRAHPPASLEPTIYNHWLEALMALAAPQTSETLPKVLRTATWHDRRIEGVLGSWAELRRDTVLVVEQSTGGGGCQYPEGYVEPVPGLYASLARAASRLAQAVPGTGQVEARVQRYLAHFQKHMARLGRMATDELAGRRLSRADLRFLNRAVDLHREEYGDRQYDGWYPTLFFTERWTATPKRNVEAGISKPVVADVHTDADRGRVLQVGVGNPALLIVALEVSGHTTLYAGPVYSTYIFEQPVTNRLTDAAWLARIWGRKLPPHPSFARAYWAD